MSPQDEEFLLRQGREGGIYPISGPTSSPSANSAIRVLKQVTQTPEVVSLIDVETIIGNADLKQLERWEAIMADPSRRTPPPEFDPRLAVETVQTSILNEKAARFRSAGRKDDYTIAILGIIGAAAIAFVSGIWAADKVPSWSGTPIEVSPPVNKPIVAVPLPGEKGPDQSAPPKDPDLPSPAQPKTQLPEPVN